MSLTGRRLVFAIALVATCVASVDSFQPLPVVAMSRAKTTAATNSGRISGRFMKGAGGDQRDKPEYSRDLLLREEAESPFRKVRFFFYASLGAAAVTSFLISATRVAAGLSGINADLLEESAVNAGVDLAGIALLAVFWQRDVKAQDSRLKRASKGAELAKLMVRGSKAMVEGYVGSSDDEDSAKTADTFTTSLASLRRGRGIEKRVVIAAGSKEKIDEVLMEATALQDSLAFNDLLIVPVIVPQCVAPIVSDPNALPDCVALPVGPSWKYVVKDELDEAVKQGIDVSKEGFCVILKKNGRVGQRTRGIFLENMVGEVAQRRDAGMDVKNI